MASAVQNQMSDAEVRNLSLQARHLAAEAGHGKGRVRFSTDLSTVQVTESRKCCAVFLRRIASIVLLALALVTIVPLFCKGVTNKIDSLWSGKKVTLLKPSDEQIAAANEKLPSLRAKSNWRRLGAKLPANKALLIATVQHARRQAKAEVRAKHIATAKTAGKWSLAAAALAGAVVAVRKLRA